MKYFDSHVHLDFSQFDGDRREVIRDAVAQEVRRFFVPGCEKEQWGRLFELAHSGWDVADLGSETLQIRIGIGLHPYFTQDLETDAGEHTQLLDAIVAAAQDSLVVAIGEIGLDKNKGACLKKQVELFELQLALARDLQLPVVMHQVGAQKEFLETLRRVGPLPRGGVVHGFGGDLSWASALLKQGLYLGVGAAILHENRSRLKATVAQLPAQSVLVETDAPDGRFRPPDGDGSARSLPVNVVAVVEKLAELWGRRQEQVAEQTFDNASLLYGY